MKSGKLLLLAFSLLAASQAQSLDTAKLDQFFERHLNLANEGINVFSARLCGLQAQQ